MIISEILKIELESDSKIYVEAIAEDYNLLYRQTLDDPPEYGSTIVSAYISLDAITDYAIQNNIKIPLDSLVETVTEYLELIDYDLNWSDYNFFSEY